VFDLLEASRELFFEQLTNGVKFLMDASKKKRHSAPRGR